MKRSIILASSFFALTLLASHPGYTHGNHRHQPTISSEKALDKAKQDVQNLVEESIPVEDKVLDSSWPKIEKGEIVKKGAGYYVVSFTHPDQKILYVLISDKGEYYDANFSGKFEGIE